MFGDIMMMTVLGKEKIVINIYCKCGNSIRLKWYEQYNGKYQKISLIMIQFVPVTMDVLLKWRIYQKAKNII